MKKTTFDVPDKASVSLASLVGRRSERIEPTPAARAAGFHGEDPEAIRGGDPVSVIIETNDPDALYSTVGNRLTQAERMQTLDGQFLSAQVTPDTVDDLINSQHVERIQSKKLKVPTLKGVLPDVRLTNPSNGKRLVQEDGSDVLIGVIDTGFDLSHPMFLDAGNKLRVEGLLDQTNRDREYTTSELETEWGSGRRPGGDDDGHGTHVASICGGTRFQDFEGVAPGARFLLVKTDFENTDDAVRWVFGKANDRPCVINMSLGHHFGAHDGTDVEERFHRSITGSGKIIVISAGNEREDNLHIGGRFHNGQSQEVVFDLLKQEKEPPYVTITLWHHETDDFDATLTSSTGQTFGLPPLGKAVNYRSSLQDIEIARRRYVWSNSIQIEITISFKNRRFRARDLQNWRLKVSCLNALVGRIDGWFHNSGYAIFRDHPFVERNRTVCLTATGDGCLAVASHVSRNTWDADVGPMDDKQAVIGRISSFSSLGPTRDGRWKPDISAPGQYVTAALADGSELSQWDERALVNERLLTIEGTSMATPVITGIVALLLQRKGTLNVNEVRRILSTSARHDAHTGLAAWDPAYGFGKVDVENALSKVP
jgi:subtilisin family serine protease